MSFSTTKATSSKPLSPEQRTKHFEAMLANIMPMMQAWSSRDGGNPAMAGGKPVQLPTNVRAAIDPTYKTPEELLKEARQRESLARYAPDYSYMSGGEGGG